MNNSALGKVAGCIPLFRIGGTISSSLYLMMQGIQILRIHDVNEVMQGVKVFNQIIKN